MIVDRLVIHHTYDGRTAFDVSQNHHHGRLEGVGVSNGVAKFEGGPDCVRVLRSSTLDEMRAVRASVSFNIPYGLQIDPGFVGETHRRFNLVEGYLSFALVVDPDRALHGTILDRSGNWRGVRSAPGTVQFGQWNTATFLHDGFSACSLSLNGTTVGVAYDVLGPVSPPRAPYGVAIGHWPDPDDRYSFIGEMSEVKVWIDRVDVVSDIVDDCCIDREKAGALFDDLRGEAFDNPDFDPAAYEHAANTMIDLGSKTAGRMASGGPADRQYAWDLGAKLHLAFVTGNRDAFTYHVAEGVQLAAAKVPEAQLDADSAALVAALQPTLMGPLVTALAGGAGRDRMSALVRKLGLDAWLESLCAGWAVPEPPREKPDRGEGDHHGEGDGGGEDKGEGKDHGDRTGSETSDRDPQDLPPSWGADGRHDESPVEAPQDDRPDDEPDEPRDDRPDDEPDEPRDDEPTRPDRPTRPEFPTRPDRPTRPDLPTRPDSPTRPDRPTRDGRDPR